MAYECARHTRDSGNIGTVVVPVTAAVPSGATVVVAVNGAALNAATGFTATDTAGNTWTERAFQVHGTPVNGQIGILTCPVETALTTSDTISVTCVSRTPDKWAVLGIAFGDVSGVDVATQTTGADGSSMSTGTTASAAQDSQMLVSAFGYTGTVTFTAQAGSDGSATATASPGAAPRSVGISWRPVDAPGARSGTGSLSGSQAWVGAIVALNTLPPLDTPAGFTLTAHPTAAEVTATWDAVGGAASYEVEVQTDDAGWVPLDTFSTSSSPLVLDAGDGIEPATTYRARVRALPGA